MERYGFLKWTDIKETFTRNREAVTRASETKSQYFVINDRKLRELPFPENRDFHNLKN